MPVLKPIYTFGIQSSEAVRLQNYVTAQPFVDFKSSSSLPTFNACLWIASWRLLASFKEFWRSFPFPAYSFMHFSKLWILMYLSFRDFLRILFSASWMSIFGAEEHDQGIRSSRLQIFCFRRWGWRPRNPFLWRSVILLKTPRAQLSFCLAWPQYTFKCTGPIVTRH